MSERFENFHDDPNIKITDGEGFVLSDHRTDYIGGFEKEKNAEKKLEKDIEKLSDLQERLYAFDHHAVLIVFQAMDAAGKDSTIEHVLKGINPQGCHITSFKRPSTLELSHDFLWRSTLALPERGKIGIFNRSYYEEVLVVKVHPEFLMSQNIPSVRRAEELNDDFWNKRYRSIRDHEKHLTENGYLILKFFLNVSKEEQKRRFLDRINEKSKNWKFEFNDLKERACWEEYMNAYEQAIRNTATPDCPWYVIPADNKWFMRTAVADIILNRMEGLDLKFPELPNEELIKLDEAKRMLEEENQN
ncbi:MAG: polyphosphate kinase 2 family protein [Flavobacteriales bacterium]|nr:polyphosphate kinase 2 family protein [Flavobacteriales bacterium]